MLVSMWLLLMAVLSDAGSVPLCCGILRLVAASDFAYFMNQAASGSLCDISLIYMRMRTRCHQAPTHLSLPSWKNAVFLQHAKQESN